MLKSVLIDKINNSLETLFSNTKRNLFSSADRYKNLPSMVELAAKVSGGLPKIDDINTLIKIASGYIDALKERTKANIGVLVAGYSDSSATSRKKIEKEIKDIFENIRAQLQTIVETETQQAQALGVLSGIIRVNTLRGINDPVIAFIPVHDTLVCLTCLRLHLMPDGITPRLWYLSEVAKGYIKRDSDRPSILLPHPNCRCLMITILPGFGLDVDGRVTWIKEGFSAIEAQRKV